MNSPFKLVRRDRLRVGGALLPLAALVSGVVQAQSEVDWDVIDQYCVECHNLDDFAGSIAFDLMERDALMHDAEAWELVIRKVRTGMMPPAGKPRPERAVLDTFTTALGATLDAEYKSGDKHSGVGLARLNREEYSNAIRDVLQFDASAIVANIPRETVGEGFDNNIDLLTVSPTLIEAYAGAAMRIGREAVGDLTLVPSEAVYSVGVARQPGHVEGLPLGTRDGLVIEHYFPLDAQYALSVDLRGSNFFTAGYCADTFRVVVSVDGQLIEVEDPKNFTLPLSAGPHTIAAARQNTANCSGAAELYDDFSLENTVAGIKINGPFEVSGVGETPSRQAIFSCYPEPGADGTACARSIVTDLATRAYRRPVEATSDEVAQLMAFFDKGEDLGGFEMGVQYAIARMLMDPRFLYQVEEPPAEAAPGTLYAVSDLELDSRLSFFLWSSIPDAELLSLAEQGQLHEKDVLMKQVKRMLADPKSQALTKNFAGQWLHLRTLAGVTPEADNFDENLREAFTQETEQLFSYVVNEDRPVIELLDADYTFANERLARHYGIDGVYGSYFRKVPLNEESHRRGLLGHGSILTITSTASRTSPVIRGSWILENLLSAPVPAPPPGVETNLDGDGDSAVTTSVRERLEAHRADPSCASCHSVIDPVGFALEHFDSIGGWREFDGDTKVDATGILADGTPIASAADLHAALMRRSELFVGTMTEKLLTYALGRGLEYYDMPTVRAIRRDSEKDDFRFSALIEGIVQSPQFTQRVKSGGTGDHGQHTASR